MTIYELQLFERCIHTLIKVQENIESRTIARLAAKAQNRKSDSLMLDTIPESTIESEMIDDYDRDIVCVTEEIGSVNKDRIATAKVIVFVDPTDRSKYLENYLNTILDRLKEDEKEKMTFGEVIRRQDLNSVWEEIDPHHPKSITGPCCSITVVKNRKILFSAFINYITREIYSGSDIGLFMVPIDKVKKTDFDSSNNISERWTKINLAPASGHNSDNFITFLGKDSYRRYFEESDVFDKNLTSLHNEPGGPARILYLTNLCNCPVGFILSNGEKITEWIGWIAFAKASKQLVGYAITPKAVFARDEILLAPSQPYSILEFSQNELVLNLEKLSSFPNPSRYREMVVITYRQNSKIKGMITNYSRKII